MLDIEKNIRKIGRYKNVATIIIGLLYFTLLPISTWANQKSPENRKFLDRISKETEEHVKYLTSIGLGERAKSIKVDWFESGESKAEEIDLAPFEKRMAVPKEVLEFDPELKNTLITTDLALNKNQPEDLKKILDIRLYPTLRNLIKKDGVEIFLGTTEEMVAYYHSKGTEILFHFSIPSSGNYFLGKISSGHYLVILAGLVSRENIVAQLLTLKLAEIDTKSIKIIGNSEHFSSTVGSDVNQLAEKIPALSSGNNILLVAGCGLEETVSKIIHEELPHLMGKSQSYHGKIISLIYTPLKKTTNNVKGIISLNLNYGEITEEIVKTFLEKFHCKHVFTGGAGGYIQADANDKKPEIGSRIGIIKSMNPNGEIVHVPPSRLETKCDQMLSKMHLQIPSIFMETYEWLKKAQECGNSVDVETFYILRAVQNYNRQYPSQPVDAECGYFVSDYVGEQPLREYSKVYQKYPEVLRSFVHQILQSH